MGVRRYDVGRLEAPKELPNGRLRVDAYPTRAGVFIYQNPDGSEFRELRSPEEVFKADSLATLSLVPVTDDHPPGMVGSSAVEFTRGVVGENVRQDGEFIRAALVLFDASLIAKMRQGKAQLSCGYTADVAIEPGVWQGQAYDAVQRNIVYDHLAVVDIGRAGPSARARMDGAGVMAESRPATSTRSDSMEELKAQLATAVAALAVQTQRADAAEKSLAEVKSDVSDAKGTADRVPALIAEITQTRLDAAKIGPLEDQVKVLKAKLDAADVALAKATSPEHLRALVKARVEIENMAAAVLGPKVKIDALGDIEAMTTVLERLGTSIPEEYRNDAVYVRATFRADCARHQAGEAELLKVRIDSRTDEKNAPKSAAQARADQNAYYANLANSSR